jgi:hypothetical protein
MECSVAGTTTLDREWSPEYSFLFHTLHFVINLLSKYRTHPTENIWKETSVEGKYREANDGEYQGRIQDSKLGGRT